MVCRSGLPETASRIIGGCLFAAKQTHTGPGISRRLVCAPSGISSDDTPTLENSGSIIGNTAPGVSVAEDIENLDAVYLNSSPLIGILDRGVAQGPIEGA
jgi:hypothetical protein